MKYQCMAHLFAEMLLRKLDAGDDDMADKCSIFMEMFFNNVNPDTVMWFTPIAEE